MPAVVTDNPPDWGAALPAARTSLFRSIQTAGLAVSSFPSLCLICFSITYLDLSFYALSLCFSDFAVILLFHGVSA